MSKRCAAHHVQFSMGAVGDCFDNAVAESFFATLETELLALVGPFTTLADAKSRIISSSSSSTTWPISQARRQRTRRPVTFR
ncbi:MAG: integrase core domain-containing protein, partial [Myxococcota bacterium]